MSAFFASLDNGQFAVLFVGGIVIVGIAVLYAAECWLDRRVSRDPVMKPLRANVRTNDNVPAALDGHRDVSTDPAKETA